MMFEHLDKPLPDDAGGTENSYRKFAGHILKNKLQFYTSRISAANVVTDSRRVDRALRLRREEWYWESRGPQVLASAPAELLRK